MGSRRCGTSRLSVAPVVDCLLMVTFLTFFLGLVLGEHTVELTVSEEVSRVVLELDGEVVGVLDGAPWQATVDFGQRLLPHDLVAIGVATDGRELARSSQKINLLKPFAEATLRLVKADSSASYEGAELVWDAVDKSDPTAVSVFFDDQPLAVVDNQRVQLPAYDPDRFHFLSAELTFGERKVAAAQVAFGGQYVETVNTELTAVALELLDGESVPELDQIRGWFVVRDQEAHVVAVETARAEVILVRDQNALAGLRRLGDTAWRMVRRWRRPIEYYLNSGLTRRDRLRFVETTPELHGSSGDFLLFTASADVNHLGGGGIATALTRLFFPHEGPDQKQRTSRAVAVAGLWASGGTRRRAVILVHGSRAGWDDEFTAENVRGFLGAVQVPFFHWTLGEPETADVGWGPARQISSLDELNAGVREVQKHLKSQIIVWLDGDHLPQEVELSRVAQTRVRFAGQPDEGREP